jgi:hypothetical protein
MSAAARTTRNYVGGGPPPTITEQTRILMSMPDSERAAFLAVAQTVLLHCPSNDPDQFTSALYLSYEVISELAAHYDDVARHDGAEWVLSALVADYEEAEDFARWLLGEREARRRAKAAAREAARV